MGDGDAPVDVTVLGARLRDALAELPRPAHVLFTAPAVTPDQISARTATAEEVAAAAGLLPWPDWAVVRHGAGTGPHLLNVIHDLGATGRARAAVVCPLAPAEPALLHQAAAVAVAAGLEVAVVGDEVIP